MAIRIELSRDRLGAAVRPFGLGLLVRVRGLPEGSINTNHRIEAATGTFFARLSTLRSEEELAFEAALLEKLRRSGLPVVPPLRLTHPPRLQWLAFAGGWLSVFPWVDGEHQGPEDVTLARLLELGKILGRLRRLCFGSDLRRPNPYGPPVVGRWLAELEGSGGGGDREVRDALPTIALGLSLAEELRGADLGLAHADLFRDNILWIGDRISAVLDFEMACTAPWALDPAVAILDWCWADGRFDPERVGALADGYRLVAGTTTLDPWDLERCLVFAAARFTLSRLRDFHFSALPEAQLVRKDWREMRGRLDAALSPEAAPLARLWL